MEKAILTTTDMVALGKCIATDESGKKILVSGSLPGETVEAEITAEKKDFCEAIAIKILKANPNRIEAKCPNFLSCGGCNFQFATTDYQVELKKKILADSLERNGVHFPAEQIIAVRDKDWNYRNRFQLHKGGLFERGTNFDSGKDSIISFGDCCIADESIKAYFENEENLNEAKKYDKYFVFGSDNKNSGGKKVYCVPAFVPQTEKNIIGKKNSKAKSGGKRKIYEGTSFDANSMTTVKIDGKEISFDVRGFFQSNLGMLEKTAELIKENFYGENLIDIYAGVGTFSVFLSDNFKFTTLVEHNRDAIVYAEMNLKKTKLAESHESFGLSGEKFAQLQKMNSNSKREFDAAVIDPPRSGIEKPVMDWLVSTKIPRIRSLSCDPVTHARDLANLVKGGYSIKKLFLLDYYPQSSHIESLAFLEIE